MVIINPAEVVQLKSIKQGRNNASWWFTVKHLSSQAEVLTVF